MKAVSARLPCCEDAVEARNIKVLQAGLLPFGIYTASRNRWRV
jgi:hypothetical protein